MQATPGSRRGSRAFSLAELMISIGILATAILLVTGVYLALFNTSQKSVDLTAGTTVAESLMREFQQRLVYDETWSGNFNRITYATETEIQSGTKSLNQTIFNYKLTAQDANGLVSGGSAPAYPMRRLRVVVNWWDDSTQMAGSQRAGKGVLTVELNRLVMYDANY